MKKEAAAWIYWNQDMPKVKSARRSILTLKKILPKKIKSALALFFLGFSVWSIAQTNTIDEKIDKIKKASGTEKKLLLKQLEVDISQQKYNSIDTNRSTENNKSIDENIKEHTSKDLNSSTWKMNKCGTGKCGTVKCGVGKKPKAAKSLETNVPTCD
ncbi:hypothetical protein [Sulfurovum lithotrophicum]|uniref:hypothetical protein n=1 Tax=Sulfurovum lithotrophicum TaxID=206403 RepID=UPI00146FF09A|nr:hypothetical protein [Sulfurovum lithotrophicum]